MMKKQVVQSRKKGAKGKRLTDVPTPEPVDVVTISAIIPKVTEYCVVRGMQSAVITAQATSAQNLTYYFNLVNAQVGTGFFDQYRIPAIRFNVRPQQNAIGLTTNSTTTVTSIYVVIDYDDANSLSGIGAYQTYSNCVALAPGQSLSRTFRPHIAMAAYTASAFSAYANESNVWIDAVSNAVQHYGVKIYVPGVTAAQTQLQSWDVEVEYFIEFRKVI
jgi:hypothetical protein